MRANGKFGLMALSMLLSLLTSSLYADNKLDIAKLFTANETQYRLKLILDMPDTRWQSSLKAKSVNQTSGYAIERLTWKLNYRLFSTEQSKLSVAHEFKYDRHDKNQALLQAQIDYRIGRSTSALAFEVESPNPLYSNHGAKAAWSLAILQRQYWQKHSLKLALETQGHRQIDRVSPAIAYRYRAKKYAFYSKLELPYNLDQGLFEYELTLGTRWCL